MFPKKTMNKTLGQLSTLHYLLLNGFIHGFSGQSFHVLP